MNIIRVEIEIITVTFETAGKFLICFVRLILPELGVERFTAPRHESDFRYECHLKVLLKGLWCK